MGVIEQVREMYENAVESITKVLSKQTLTEKKFVPQKELGFLKSNLKFVEMPEPEVARLLLEELSHSFDAGLLFCNKDEKDVLVAKCIHGKNEEIETFTARLPDIPLDKIQKTNAKKIAAKWQLYLPEFSGEALALLYRPCENYKYLLFSELPEIILRDVAEQTHDVLLRAFADS